MKCPVCMTPMIAATEVENPTCDSCLTVRRGKRTGDHVCPKCDYYLCSACANIRDELSEEETDTDDSMFPEDFFDEEVEE